MENRRPPIVPCKAEVPTAWKSLWKKPVSFVIMLATAVAIVAAPPAQSHLVDYDDVNEEHVVRAFLNYQLLHERSPEICFNTTLGELSMATLDAFKETPLPPNPTPSQINYTNDLRTILLHDWKHLNTSRSVRATAKEWQEMKARPASFEECENIASYKIGRAMTKGNVGIIIGSVSYPCHSSTFAMNFRKEKLSWIPKYLNGYYSVSAPGCGDFSKSNPGKRTDSFIIIRK